MTDQKFQSFFERTCINLLTQKHGHQNCGVEHPTKIQFVYLTYPYGSEQFILPQQKEEYEASKKYLKQWKIDASKWDRIPGCEGKFKWKSSVEEKRYRENEIEWVDEELLEWRVKSDS